ncbi:MAG TPA: hypothetical protein VF603_15260 [Allosphingosinicella sp.]|jgi:hypothetical protein
MSPADDHLYYSQLEAGARYLAAGANSPTERDTHLGMASRYARLRADAEPAGLR